jgi:hypothetical protein
VHWLINVAAAAARTCATKWMRNLSASCRDSRGLDKSARIFACCSIASMTLPPLVAVALDVIALRIVRDVHVVPGCRLSPIASGFVCPVHDVGVGNVRAVK